MEAFSQMQALEKLANLDGSTSLKRSYHKRQNPVGSVFCGAPDRIRTCGPQLRKLMLYPAELRVHVACKLGNSTRKVLIRQCLIFGVFRGRFLP